MYDSPGFQLEITSAPEAALIGRRYIFDETVTRAIGRAPTSDIELVAPSISRRHAEIRKENGRWVVVDLDSRHGTLVNSELVSPSQSMRLRVGDRLRIGPFILRVKPIGAGTSEVVAVDRDSRDARVTIVQQSELGGLAQHRLSVLMESADALAGCVDLESLAFAATHAAAKGTRCRRAILLRPSEDGSEVEVIARQGDTDGDEGELDVSRSLVGTAIEGRLAQLGADCSGGGMGGPSPSILDLGIRSAICAPIMLDEKVAALLYLDARGGEHRLENDAASFCEALAHLCAMALATLDRVDLARRQAQLNRDLEAARRAQELIMPETVGMVGPVRYVMMSSPGRGVAGDLFDVVPVDDELTLVLLGDVAGKGIGAALTMATVQTYIRAAAQHTHDPAELARDVNRFVVGRIRDGIFVTLWLGLVDRAAGVMHTVDAGHGHFCCVPTSGAPFFGTSAGDIPIGVAPDTEYVSSTLDLNSISRLVLFSDGLLEQTDGNSVQFGPARVLEVLAGSSTPEDDVARLEQAVRTYAGSSDLDDDLTIASIQHIVQNT